MILLKDKWLYKIKKLLLKIIISVEIKFIKIHCINIRKLIQINNFKSTHVLIHAVFLMRHHLPKIIDQIVQNYMELTIQLVIVMNYSV
jgi:hypothetical protein